MLSKRVIFFERERRHFLGLERSSKNSTRKRTKKSSTLTLRRGLPAELRSHGHDRDGQADPVRVAEAERGGELGDDAGKGRAQREEVGVVG